MSFYNNIPVLILLTTTSPTVNVAKLDDRSNTVTHTISPVDRVRADTRTLAPGSPELIQRVINTDWVTPEEYMIYIASPALFNQALKINSDIGTDDLHVPDTVGQNLAISSPTIVAKVGRGTIKATVDPPGNSEQNPIEYLALPVTGKKFTVNTSSPHLPYMSAIIKVKELWFRTVHFNTPYHMALNRMLQLVDKHRPTGGGPMTYAEWVRVALLMPRIRDCNKPDVVFDPILCQNYVLNALDLYKKTLEVCPNMDRAGLSFPMFNTLHMFNTESVVSDAECREIARLRQLFAHKCRTAAYIEGRPLEVHVSLDVTPLTLTSTKPGIANASQSDAPVVARVSQQIVSSGAAPQAPSVSPLSKPLVNKNELAEFRQMVAKITRDDLLAFTQLCHCMGVWVKTMGRLTIDNQELFWSHVSQLMLVSGYGTYSKDKCCVMFTNHVTKYYKITLKYFPKYTKAIKVYPYFAVIHAMDLSQLMFKKSYNKIKVLRNAFTN